MSALSRGRGRGRAMGAAIGAVLAVSLAPPPPLLAQVIRGTVMDERTGDPVRAAGLVVVDSTGAEIRTVMADSTGRFFVPLRASGRYMLVVEHLSYEEVLTPWLSIPGDSTLDVEIRLTPLPFMLDPVVASGERQRRRLERAGFYSRRALGAGRYFEADEIERLNPLLPSDLLRLVPGVRILPLALTNGSMVTFRSATRHRIGGEGSGGVFACAPTLALNGMIVRNGGAVDQNNPPPILDELVHAAEIAGLEVYPSGAGLPARFGGMFVPCGAILVWTR